MQFVKYLRYATVNAGDGVGTTAAVEGKPSVDQPNDALDVIFTQDQIIADLFGVWHQASEQLSQRGRRRPEVAARFRREVAFAAPGGARGGERSVGAPDEGGGPRGTGDEVG